MAIKFSISDWCGWIQQDPAEPATTIGERTLIRRSEAPDVSTIPAMLRRRLNLLGRAAASQLLSLPGSDGSNTAIVYCSRHGDIERTLSILQDLASDAPVSPMNFSLAVHNAVSGILSIHGGVTANISSIAAGREGLVPALLEAAGMLSSGYRRVICLLCDVSLPEIYRSPSYRPEQAFAACFALSVDEGTALTLEYAGMTSNDSQPVPASTPPLCFVEFLSTGSQAFSTCHNGGKWLLRKY